MRANILLNLLMGGQIKKVFDLTYYKFSTLTNPDNPPFPVHALLGSTNICNLKCRMCPRRDPKLKKEMNSEMSFDQFKMLIDQMPQILDVTPEALGEPFLHKDIFKMIKYAKSKGINVNLHTNGMLVDKKMAEKIFDSGLTELYFSLDGSTKKTYEYIRVGANFERVTKNIKNIVKMRDERKSSIHISLKPVIMKENLEELPLFIPLAHDLGIKNIEFSDVQYLYDIENKEVLSTKEQSLRISREKKKIKKIFKITQRLADKYGIKIALPEMVQNTTLTKCRYPWTTLTVTPQGFVRPCCGVHTLHFGNVFEETVKDVWNKPNFVAWRKAMRSNNPPPICLTCTSF